MLVRRSILFVLALAAPPALVTSACGSHTDGSPSGGSDAAVIDERQRLDGPIHPDAACLVTIDEPPIVAALHVPIPTAVQYNSNPPSSGPHYPYWAAYQSFAKPVDPRYWVHNLEHGAIALLYKCDVAGGCTDVVNALRAAADALPDDPICNKAAGVRVRVVLTPDPDLDVPVAASAWGWTYKAACIDMPSLTSFVLEHYGQGGESNCTNGIPQF